MRRILIKRDYQPADQTDTPDLQAQIIHDMQNGQLDAQSLLGGYCTPLYRRTGSYEQVARKTKLDRRTVKKYSETFD